MTDITSEEWLEENGLVNDEEPEETTTIHNRLHDKEKQDETE